MLNERPTEGRTEAERTGLKSLAAELAASLRRAIEEAIDADLESLKLRDVWENSLVHRIAD